MFSTNSYTKMQQRTQLLIGDEALARLEKAHILIAGLGGVGGHCLEAIVRAGIGKITLVDFDVIDITNLNRQILASEKTIGRAKVEVARERVLDINPKIRIFTHQLKLEKESVDDFLDRLSDLTAIIDCIDQFEAKCQLLSSGYRRKIAVFSSMGAGRRIDPTQVKIADISNTNRCGLARKIRRKLKEWDIHEGITTVFSEEMPKKSESNDTTIGSISYMPAIFGQMLAGALIYSLIHPLKNTT